MNSKLPGNANSTNNVSMSSTDVIVYVINVLTSQKQRVQMHPLRNALCECGAPV